MASQKKILMGKTKDSMKVIWQPDTDMEWSFETTYTEGSTRTQTGVGKFTPMFTTESLAYKASDIPIKEMQKILNIIIGKKFYMRYYAPYARAWITKRFYVGTGSLSIGLLKKDEEIYSSLEFNVIAIYSIEHTIQSLKKANKWES